MRVYKNQRTVHEYVNILFNQVYEWVIFFEDQVYDWDLFQKLARTPVLKLPSSPPPPPPEVTSTNLLQNTVKMTETRFV